MSLKSLAKLVKQVSASKETPAKQFQQYLNQAIIMLERENAREPSQTYKPSSLGGCNRRVYFEVTGAETDKNPEIDPDFVGVAESGTDRHERIQSAIMEMKRLGIECEWVDVEEYLKMYPQEGTEIVERKGNEMKLRNTKYNLSFMCDGIIKFGGNYYVLEIKTEVSFKWNGRTEAEPKHIVQASTYSLALGIDDIMFVYEQRDMCKKKFIHVKVTAEDKKEKVIDVINEVETHIKENTIPEKTDKKNECTYCPFTQVCKQH